MYYVVSHRHIEANIVVPFTFYFTRTILHCILLFRRNLNRSLLLSFSRKHRLLQFPSTHIIATFANCYFNFSFSNRNKISDSEKLKNCFVKQNRLISRLYLLTRSHIKGSAWRLCSWIICNKWKIKMKWKNELIPDFITQSFISQTLFNRSTSCRLYANFIA